MEKITIIITIIMALNMMTAKAESISSINCIGNDDKWYTFANDPQNGTDIIVSNEVYRFISESKIGNKKVSTYKSDYGIISNIILIVDPETNTGDIYIVIYKDNSNKRDMDVDKLHLHCKI